MSNHKSRLSKLETESAPEKKQRVIILEDGKYTERRIELSEADYQALAQDPAYEVILLEIVRASEVKHETP